MAIKKLKKMIRKIIYWFLDGLRIKNNKIVFQNFYGNAPGGNGKYIMKALLKSNQADKLDIVWLLKEPENVKLPKGVRGVKYNSFEAYKELATAKVWIDNEKNGMRATKKKGTFFLQVWHSGFGPKPSEFDAKDTLSNEYLKLSLADSEITDAVLSDSNKLDEWYERAFKISPETKILRFGLPSNDLFVHYANEPEAKAAMRKRLDLDPEDYVVLYAPTFRDDGSDEGYLSLWELDDVREAFQKKTGKTARILVRMHPNAKNKIQTDGVEVIDVTDYPDISELSLMCDAGISDYSTAILDFYHMRRPGFILALDIEAYKETRGLLDEFYEMPFPHAYTESELLNAIESFDEEAYLKGLDKYKESIVDYNEGNAARKAAAVILRHLKLEK